MNLTFQKAAYVIAALMLAVVLAVFATVAVRNAKIARAWPGHVFDVDGEHAALFASDEAKEHIRWLNSFAKRKTLTAEDAERMLAIHRSNQPYDANETSQWLTSHREGTISREELQSRYAAQSEDSLLHEAPLHVAAAWLRTGRSIEPAAKVSLTEALLLRLESDDPAIRTAAVSLVVYARLVADQNIRTRIESMRDDPHPDVALNAVKQLRHFDRIEDLRRRGKWREQMLAGDAAPLDQ